MPVAIVSKTSFGKGAPFADETRRKGSCVKSRGVGLEEPRGDALAVSALAVAGSAVADVRLVSGKPERVGGDRRGVLDRTGARQRDDGDGDGRKDRSHRGCDDTIAGSGGRDASQADSGRVSLRHAVPDRQGRGPRHRLLQEGVRRPRDASRWKAPTAKVGHAEIEIGNSRVMLADEHPEVGSRRSRRRRPPPSRSCSTSTTSTSGSRARSPRARSRCAPVADQFYGDRSGMLDGSLRPHVVDRDAQGRSVAGRAAATGRGGAQEVLARERPAMARSFLRIALVFLATRALLVVATFVSWPLPRMHRVRGAGTRGSGSRGREGAVADRGEGRYIIHPPAWLDSFARMDASYYLSIAAVGYAPVPGEPAHPATRRVLPGIPGRRRRRGPRHQRRARPAGAPLHEHPGIRARSPRSS